MSSAGTEYPCYFINRLVLFPKWKILRKYMQYHIFSAVEHNQKLDLHILVLCRYTNGTITDQIG